GLSWPMITNHFLGHTPRAIKVRYHTSKEEWEMEKIYNSRQLDNGSIEFLVRWGG
ncbi:hypothetical protein B0H67DRAFT_489230, partial [Lasiosphaeris hirsuta]